ncbi:MAG: hypothetical protein ACRD44_05840, partial [Bryobacteraceae bacterium]
VQLQTDQPNLVEGRELNNPHAVALDTSLSPPAIYVSDTGNNRVLAWRNAANFENGAPADRIIGQRDRFSTSALGPGTTLTSGLAAPTGLAVDASGNLYISDGANNRIIRFARPFSQPEGEQLLPDLVIGQTSLTSRTANAGGLSDKSIATTATISGTLAVFETSMIFDRAGNLWFTDAANHRVLRYPASSLGPGATNFPAAEVVLGQPDFNTNAALGATLANRTNKSRMNAPASVALDQDGRLFVADLLNRVLVFAPGFINGMFAARIMGIVPPPAAGQPAPLPINEYSMGIAVLQGNTVRFAPPEGVFTIGNVPFVLDTAGQRILRYDRFDEWPAEFTTASPPAKAVIGQDSLSQDLPRANRGRSEPGPNTLAAPRSAIFVNGEVFVVDSQNNRVIVFPDLSNGPAIASGAPYLARRLLGQVGFEFRQVNFIEGREFFFRSSVLTAAGVAVDRNSTPPRLYIADPNNHRVLGFADARKVRPGDRADLVIGQVDLLRSLLNSPGDTGAPTDTGLAFPTGLAVDAEGNLWIADQGNSRVVRYAKPFQQTERPLRADMVIGQSNLTTRITDPTSRTMGLPFGVAFTVEGHLLASDIGHHRVLMFERPLSNGMAATRVFGQPDFGSVVTGNTASRLNSPRHIAIDIDDRLYVADTANNRVQIFTRVTGASPDPAAVFTLARNVRTPHGVAIAPSGEIWVANTGTNGILRYPRFDTLTLQGDVNDDTIALPNTPSVISGLAVGLDGFGNLYVADSAHRVGIHFHGMAALNAANSLPRMAPGLIASIYAQGPDFADQTMVFNQLPNPLPLPRELADVQVLVNDKPAPLYFVSPRQINFLVPSDTPESGTAEVQVVRVSTGQILAAFSFAMQSTSPGLFTDNGQGTGQLAALNENNIRNGSSNPLTRGQTIQLFGTGSGVIPGGPPDGEAAAGPAETPVRPRVFVNVTGAAVECTVAYSGVAPGLVGVWQINAVIPATTPVPAGGVSALAVILGDVASQPPVAAALRTTIAIR